MYLIRKFIWLASLALLAACSTPVASQAGLSQSQPQSGSAAAADSWIYLSPEQVDTTRFLGPPPDAAASRQEIELMLLMQSRRTPEQERRAAADHQQSVYRFADVMGEQFRRERLPHTTHLFALLHETANALEKQGKKKWQRVRPPQADARIRPVAKYARSGSYPSGHATSSFLAGIVLADLVPEQSEKIFARAREFGENRVVAGVHYPSDVAAGQRLATLIAALIQQNPAYRQDYAAARSELRGVLGLP